MKENMFAGFKICLNVQLVCESFQYQKAFSYNYLKLKKLFKLLRLHPSEQNGVKTKLCRKKSYKKK